MARPRAAGDRACAGRTRAADARLTDGRLGLSGVDPDRDATIRVVLAKEAISTGWDCPRAEVLYSERPAKDATHIAQIIGRMVRQPLAHRIATDDALNSVTCYLPLFDQKALTTIKDELEGKGADNGQNRVGATVVRAPMVFERNALLDPAVFAFIEGLPSIPTPDRTASPLRRARTLGAAARRRRRWRAAARGCRGGADEATEPPARWPGRGARRQRSRRTSRTC